MSDFDLQKKIIEDSVFIIGRVFSVKGRSIIVKVNKDKNLPHLFFNGKTIRNVSVGLSNYVKIIKGFTQIICKVEGEYLEEDKYPTNKEYTNEKQKINRFLNVSVFGFYDDDKMFQHGIKEMPLIGSECKLLSRDEFEELHQISKENEFSIHLGCLIDEEIQNISIPVKKLFAGHIGIFGNTGSGKSNTLAKMYTELFHLEGLGDNFKTKSQFIFIDFNGEYSKESHDEILTKEKKVYILRTKDNEGIKYPILKSEIEKLELLSILLNATEKTQQPFLSRAINNDWLDKDNDTYYRRAKEGLVKKIRGIFNKNDSTFSQPFLKKIVSDFRNCGVQMLKKENNQEKNLDDITYNTNTTTFKLRKNYHSDDPTRSDQMDIIDEYFDIKIEDLDDLQKIQFKILDQYYHEVLNGYVNQEHINPLIGRLKKRFDMLDKVFDVISTNNDLEEIKNIQVINLKNVNLEMKKVVPLLICKSIYDGQKNKRDTDSQNSLNIIIDEAHNILSETSVREAESWRDYRLETFEEIIKEGRKFGVFLTIASQRPSDISPTIISQLHNYFIHRLMNNKDLESINRAVSYLDKLSFDSISNLSVGCCFIAGQMTQFPLSVKVELLSENKRPQSETIDLDELWKKDPPPRQTTA